MSALLAAFDALCDAPAAEREARLNEIAEDDAALAAQLRSMLAADREPTAFLARDISAQSVLNPTVWARPDRTGQRFSAYTLLRELGTGGMGAVWLAERQLGASVQHVAIKFMHRPDDARLMGQFERERNALARLEHPAIARLIDAGLTPDGEPFIATEFVDGVPLLTYVRTQLSALHERLLLIESLCEAVDYAHRRLLVHRDIKPSNVMVDGAGRARLLDFGIAKALDPVITEQTLNNPLSPAYASPEQALGEPVSTATDVFALGLLLFELLTGQLPRQRRTLKLGEMAARISGETIEAPSSTELATIAAIDPVLAARDWPKQLRGDLDQIVLTALHREPERRYPSALALAADLKRWREGRPILARPDSASYRLRKLIRRHPLVTTASALALVLVTVLSTLAFLQSLKAERAAARALRAQDFVLSIFLSADQTQTRGEKLTAKEILASASARLDKEFADDPQQQAELKLKLAEIYGNASNPERAKSLAQEVLVSAEKLHAGNSELKARALMQLAMLAYDEGEFKPGLALSKQAVDALRALRLANQSLLATALMDRGALITEIEADAALGLSDQQEGLALLAAETGTKSVAYGRALTQRAMLFEELDRFAEARADYAAGVAILAREYGDVHPRTANARLALAGVLDRLGEPELAQMEFEKTVTAMRKLYDNRGNELAAAVFSQGIFFQTIGELAQAERNYRETIALGGTTAQFAAHAYRYLGQVLVLTNRASEAAQAFERAVDGYARVYGENNPQGWRTQADWGGAELALGQSDAALKRQRLAVERLEQLLGAQANELIRPLRALAQTELALKRFPDAEQHFTRALALAGAQLGEAHVTTCGLRRDLAAVALAAGETGALPTLRERLANCRAALAAKQPNAPVLQQVDETLAQLKPRRLIFGARRTQPAARELPYIGSPTNRSHHGRQTELSI